MIYTKDITSLRKHFAVPFACALLIFVGAVPCSSQDAATIAPNEITFNLRGIDGKDYDLTQMRGQIVVVSFGATWCVPCIAELEALESLKREYANQPVRFLWVSVETKKEISNGELRRYAKTQRLTMPVLRDMDRTAFLQFSRRLRLPLIAIFDQSGSFVTPAQVGMGNPDAYKDHIRNRLDALLQSNSR
jgi:thiol-disulfide isomerase/thioredoxin